jgi:hypothetical protein
MRETIPVLVSIPHDVHQAGRAEAMTRGVSFSKFLAGMIRKELKLPRPKRDVQKSAPRQWTEALEAAAA